MPLKKTTALRHEPMLKTRIRVHLHLQQHHRKLQAAGFRITRAFLGPQHTIETVAQLLQFQGLKVVMAITGRGWVQAQ